MVPAPVCALYTPLTTMSKPNSAIERHPHHAAVGPDPFKTLPRNSDLHHGLLRGRIPSAERIRRAMRIILTVTTRRRRW